MLHIFELIALRVCKHAKLKLVLTFGDSRFPHVQPQSHQLSVGDEHLLDECFIYIESPPCRVDPHIFATRVGEVRYDSNRPFFRVWENLMLDHQAIEVTTVPNLINLGVKFCEGRWWQTFLQGHPT